MKASFLNKKELKISLFNRNFIRENQLSQTYKNKCSNEKIKCLLKEVLYNSLAQAMIKIIQTPHLAIKLFLIVCVVSSSSLASYLVIESIMQYFTYGVTTTSRTIFETPTLFPKVTLCNYNRLGTKYAYDLMRLGSLDVKSLSNEEKKKLGHDLKDILLNCEFNGNPCDFCENISADFINKHSH